MALRVREGQGGTGCIGSAEAEVAEGGIDSRQLNLHRMRIWGEAKLSKRSAAAGLDA